MAGKGDRIRTDVTSPSWGEFYDRVFGRDDEEVPTRDELVDILKDRPARPWLEDDYKNEIM